MNINIIVFTISSIIASVLLIVASVHIYKKPIVIRHRLAPYDWFWVHMAVSGFTMCLMLFTDMFYIAISGIEIMPLSIMGVVCLFCQSGGLVVIVMFIASIIYNWLAKIIYFNYFIERHAWIRKVFFSVMCLTMAIIYSITIFNQSDNINILDNDCKFIMMWIIVLIQIWIGFGMRTEGFFSGINKIVLQYKKLKETSNMREEKKYIVICLLSIIVVPIVITILYVLETVTSKKLADLLLMIVCGVGVGTILMFVTIFVYSLKFQPPRSWSFWLFSRNFDILQFGKIRGRFMRIEYSLEKRGNQYTVYIPEEKIEFEDENNFPHEYIKHARTILGEYNFLYSLDENSKYEIKEKIVSQFVNISLKRKGIVHEGFDEAYAMFIKIEKMKLA